MDARTSTRLATILIDEAHEAAARDRQRGLVRTGASDGITAVPPGPIRRNSRAFISG